MFAHPVQCSSIYISIPYRKQHVSDPAEAKHMSCEPHRHGATLINYIAKHSNCMVLLVGDNYLERQCFPGACHRMGVCVSAHALVSMWGRRVSHLAPAWNAALPGKKPPMLNSPSLRVHIIPAPCTMNASATNFKPYHPSHSISFRVCVYVCVCVCVCVCR